MRKQLPLEEIIIYPEKNILLMELNSSSNISPSNDSSPKKSVRFSEKKGDVSEEFVFNLFKNTLANPNHVVNAHISPAYLPFKTAPIIMDEILGSPKVSRIFTKLDPESPKAKQSELCSQDIDAFVKTSLTDFEELVKNLGEISSWNGKSIEPGFGKIKNGDLSLVVEVKYMPSLDPKDICKGLAQLIRAYSALVQYFAVQDCHDEFYPTSPFCETDTSDLRSLIVRANIKFLLVLCPETIMDSSWVINPMKKALTWLDSFQKSRAMLLNKLGLVPPSFEDNFLVWIIPFNQIVKGISSPQQTSSLAHEGSIDKSTMKKDAGNREKTAKVSFTSSKETQILQPNRKISIQKEPVIALKEISLFTGSSILSSSVEQKLLSLFDRRPLKSSLLFDMRTSHMSSASFHEACDERGPNLVLVRTDNKDIFGYFVSTSFISCLRTDDCDNCFLFSLQNQFHNELLKIPIPREGAIYQSKWNPIIGNYLLIDFDDLRKSFLSCKTNYNSDLTFLDRLPLPDHIDKRTAFTLNHQKWNVDALEIYQLEF